MICRRNPSVSECGAAGTMSIRRFSVGLLRLLTVCCLLEPGKEDDTRRIDTYLSSYLRTGYTWHDSHARVSFSSRCSLLVRRNSIVDASRHSFSAATNSANTFRYSPKYRPSISAVVRRICQRALDWADDGFKSVRRTNPPPSHDTESPFPKRKTLHGHLVGW